MDAISKFNDLNGKVVSRAEISILVADAIEQEQFHIARRLQSVMDLNTDEHFEFEILTPAISGAPLSALYCLDCQEIQSDEINFNTALNKAVSADEIYSYITDMLINTIRKVGHLPWQKEWVGSGSNGEAKNYVSKKPYGGANFLLNFDVKYDENGQPYLVPIKFEQPYYLTFNQIQDAKAKLKQGSKARRVIYYTMIFDYKSDQLTFRTSDQEKFTTFISQNGLTSEHLKDHLNRIPVIKYYNVFRADDCEGLKFPSPAVGKQVDPIQEAQSIIDGYENPPKYTFVGDQAYYMPATDTLNMPRIEAFSREEFYYSTFFHEQVHSTGHSKRLNRGNDTRKRDGGKADKQAYAFEELVAEMGAVYLCSEAGILFTTKENSAKYLKFYNDRLVAALENDNRFFLKASAQAKKAADLILNKDSSGNRVRAIAQNKAPKKLPPKKAEQMKLKFAEAAKAHAAPMKPAVSKNPKKPKTAVLTALNGDVNDENTVAAIAAEDPHIQIENAAPGSLAELMARPKIAHETYKIENPDLSEFLGEVEKKLRESVVITLAGGQGSMKTRELFQMINAFAQNYKCGHASLEEHPSSKLYFDKAKEYLNAKALHNVSAPEINSIEGLYKLIEESECIFIDSFAKLQEIDRRFEIDKDLRKKFDGKLFVVIYQQTTDGKMRGGSKSQFDGDIILLTEAFADYRQNYIYPIKNRYNSIPLDQLKLNIFSGKLIRPEKPKDIANDHKPRKYKFVQNG